MSKRVVNRLNRAEQYEKCFFKYSVYPIKSYLRTLRGRDLLRAEFDLLFSIIDASQENPA